MRYVLTLVIAVAAAGCSSGITCDDGDPPSARCPGQPNSDGSEDVFPVCIRDDECSHILPVRRVMCTESGPECDGVMKCVDHDEASELLDEAVERCRD